MKKTFILFLLVVYPILSEPKTETLQRYTTVVRAYKRYSKTSDHSTSLKKAKQALELSHELYGKNSLQAATWKEEIGKQSENLLDYNKAMDSFQAALQIREKLLKKNNEKRIRLFFHIGMIHYKIKNYESSLQYLSSFFKNISSRLEKKYSQQLAIAYNSIASIYYHSFQYDLALEYTSKALTICSTYLGEDHPDVANTYNNIGNIYFRKSEYSQAIDAYNKTIDVRKKIFTEDHIDVASGYNNLGNVYYKLDDYQNAKSYYTKTLKIRQKALGEDHDSVADVYNNLSMVYQKKKMFDTSLEYLNQSLFIRMKNLGLSHPLIAQTYNNLGVLYAEKKDYDTSLKYHYKAIKILETTDKIVQHINSYIHIYEVYKIKSEPSNIVSTLEKIAELVTGSENQKVLLTKYKSLLDELLAIYQINQENEKYKSLLEKLQ